MTKVVGITGLVASGKSTLTNYLKNKGYRIFDCDSNVKQIYQNSYFLKQLQSVFPDVFNKNNLLDKNLLANKIYNNRLEKEKLESLIHPIVEQNCDIFIKENEKEKIIFLEVPLLFEVGWDKKCSQIILVMVDENKLKERFLNRGGTEIMFTNILKNQSNTKFKIKNSNYIIYNNSSIEDFYFKIDIIEKQILNII